MCGYVRRTGSKIQPFLKKLGLDDLWGDKNSEMDMVEHFYPAFGGNAGRQIKQLIIKEEGKAKAVNATWWFECTEQDGQLIVNNSMTTFNARNLESRYWKGAIRHHRGIVVATGIGESIGTGKDKRQYLMEGDEPIMLGAVYRKFPNDLYSAAVITRDAHPRFDEYHDKAFPLFLPQNREFIDLWLSDAPEAHPEIADLLENPRIYTGLEVTRVKTFKDGVAMGAAAHLAAD